LGRWDSLWQDVQAGEFAALDAVARLLCTLADAQLDFGRTGLMYHALLTITRQHERGTYLCLKTISQWIWK
jgi:hypothetical protein